MTASQARAAGFPDTASAQAELDQRPAKHVYAIAVSYAGPDERPELAADDALTGNDVALISGRLKALGLTISLAVGYRISPRGNAFLRRTP